MRGGRRLRIAGAATLAAVLLATGSGSADDLVRTGSPAAHGATIIRYSLRSRFVAGLHAQVIAEPAGGGAGRGLLVFLHGRSAGPESNVNDAFLRALSALGSAAPDVVFPDGGDHSYWHTRASGDWTHYVLDEVIPRALALTHADGKRIAIGGESMGGYGAYEIASVRPNEFCAVGGHSAALWLAPGDSAAGAFDDAQDYERHDVVALARSKGAGAWGHAQLWLDGGVADPFHDADTVFAQELGVPLRVWPGGHDFDYWEAHYGDYLRFYAGALAHCRQ